MADIRIDDILKTEYGDFLEFCLNADKQYRYELVNDDYVAFRSQYGFSCEYIAKLRKYIESFKESDDVSLNKNDDLSVNIEGYSSAVDLERGECTPSIKFDADITAEVFVKSDTNEPVESEAVSAASQVVPFEFLGNRVEIQPVQSVSLSFESEMPLSQFFSVNWEVYCDMPLMESDLGTRAYNCLSKGHKQDDSIASCKTIGDVLQLSPLQISNYKNMGKRSYDRIISALSRIVQYRECVDENIPPVGNILKTQVLAMLHDEPFDISAFNDEEKLHLRYTSRRMM